MRTYKKYAIDLSKMYKTGLLVEKGSPTYFIALDTSEKVITRYKAPRPSNSGFGMTFDYYMMDFYDSYIIMNEDLHVIKEREIWYK